MSQSASELRTAPTESVSADVPADPDAVFASITDVARLPDEAELFRLGPVAQRDAEVA